MTEFIFLELGFLYLESFFEGRLPNHDMDPMPLLHGDVIPEWSAAHMLQHLLH